MSAPCTPRLRPDATEPARPHGLLPAWGIAELPRTARFTPRNVLRTIGPGIIGLGIAIGSGEWLLGPCDRRALRAGAAVGHDRLGAPAGVPQHRDGALHDVHGRAGHRRVHADEARARFLVGGVRAPDVSADRMARMGARERDGERGADPRPHPVGGRRSARQARRLRHVRRLRGNPRRRPEGRAEPRVRDVDPDGRGLRLPAGHRSDDGVGRVVAGDRRRLRVVRRAAVGRRLVSARRVRRLLGARRHVERVHDELDARQGLRHGRHGRLHPGRRRRARRALTAGERLRRRSTSRWRDGIPGFDI